MRYDKEVSLCRVVEGGRYDAETGKLTKEQVDKHTVLANVTNMGSDRTLELFGAMTVEKKTVRLQTEITERYDYIEIDGLKYAFDKILPLRQRTTLIVGEYDG